MEKEMMKGSIDILLLSLLAEQDRYGYEMTKQLRFLSDEAYSMNEGTLYPALKRLEKQGYVTSYWQVEAIGKRRKYYALTDVGREQLKQKIASWEQLTRLIERTAGELYGSR
ncbi:PadR family transcriptional regulator [Lysinibacillus endophyticus]|uniref:PadR family transcriptional regulator n=1 Tax=Ureibacillus endophyticus TaxID=1978490 RepID=UPI003135B2BA